MQYLRVGGLNFILSLLVLLVFYGLFQLDSLLPFELPTWLAPFAWDLFLLGGVLVLWAEYTLIRYAGSSGAPGDPTRCLVESGPYDLTRNPIYIGVILLVFGVAFFTHSPSTLVFALVLPLLASLYVRKVEEPGTEARFGEDYREYKQRIPRWFLKLPEKIKPAKKRR
jgi:protein-S-isoprenylcysteine O-methyltransferase Ste14